jgi:hypothetical protein
MDIARFLAFARRIGRGRVTAHARVEPHRPVEDGRMTPP